MKKIFTFAVALLATFSASADELWGLNGTGTESDPYQIASAADFYTMAQKCSAQNTGADKFFKVTADIDFGGTAESPKQLPGIAKSAITNVTTIAYGFQGVLDGDNHTVSGIYHTDNTNSTAGKFNALISSLGEGGVVKNLTFSANNYITSYNYTSPFVSLCKGGTIENCTNHASVTCTNTFAAGICGYICGGKGSVKDCSNTGSMRSMSYAAGIISGSQSGSAVGSTDADYASVVVEGCTNSGSVSTSNGVGSAGIAGSFSGKILDCENTADIDDSKGTSSSKQYTGGIVSCMTYVAGVSGNVNTGSVKGGNYVAGIVGCIMKGSNETVDISGNTNKGTIEATGSNHGDILGGSKRDADKVTTAIASISADASSASVRKVLSNGRVIFIKNNAVVYEF